MRALLLTGRSEDVLARFPEPLALLTGRERAGVAATAGHERRDTMVAARLLARMCVARLLGTDPSDVTVQQRCDSCGRPHGRPTVVGAVDVAVSWSHAEDQIAALAGSAPLGVDIETPRADYRTAVPGRVLSPTELRWMRAADDPRLALISLWVRKEALIKAGLLTLGRLRTTDLITGTGHLTERHSGQWLTGWHRGPVVGACCLPHPPRRLDITHL